MGRRMMWRRLLFVGAALCVLFFGVAARPQQVRVVHGSYLLLSLPPLAGQVGDSLVIFRASEQGLLRIGTAVLDELYRGRAICRLVGEIPPHKVRVGDWLVSPGARTPATVHNLADSGAKAQVVAVHGDQVLIAGSCAPHRAGNVVAIERREEAGVRLTGTVRLSQADSTHAVGSIVSESPGEQIRPGDRVSLSSEGPGRAQAERLPSPRGPRVAKVAGGHVLVDGLPPDWPPDATLQVVRQSKGKTTAVGAVKLLQRRGERGVAALVKARRGQQVQEGDVLVLVLTLPAVSEPEDLDTYFFATRRPPR